MYCHSYCCFNNGWQRHLHPKRFNYIVNTRTFELWRYHNPSPQWRSSYWRYGIHTVVLEKVTPRNFCWRARECKDGGTSGNLGILTKAVKVWWCIMTVVYSGIGNYGALCIFFSLFSILTRWHITNGSKCLKANIVYPNSIISILHFTSVTSSVTI